MCRFVGKFIYGVTTTSVEIEDRALAHLRLALMHKLRRAEPFMFDVEVSASEGSGRRSFWIHPGVPLQFQFYGSRTPSINRAWVDELVLAANSAGGLTLKPEAAVEVARAS
jgi:hypothetical protein